MQLENPLLQFDFSSLAGRQGGLLPMPELQDREQQLVGMPELQGFPALLDSGFNRQVQRGPVYALTPQTPNLPLYASGGDPSASPAGYGGPSTGTPGEAAAIAAAMAMGPVAGLAAIGGVVAQAMGMNMGPIGDALGMNPRGTTLARAIDSLLGFRAPVDEVDLGLDGLGFDQGPHAGAAGYGGDRGGEAAGHGGTAGGANGAGAPGGGPGGHGEAGAATGGY